MIFKLNFDKIIKIILKDFIRLKKLVIKTALITLASLLGAVILTYCALLIFAPKVLGNFFDGAGGYSASVFFYEKQYEKTGDIQDLNTLVLKLDIDDDKILAEKYYEKMVLHEDFDSFCQAQDQNNGSTKASDYYIGNYCLLLARNGKFDQALTLATECLKDGYSQLEPVRALIYKYINYGKPNEANEILIKIFSSAGSVSSSGHASTVKEYQIDKAYLEDILKVIQENS